LTFHFQFGDETSRDTKGKYYSFNSRSDCRREIMYEITQNSIQDFSSHTFYVTRYKNIGNLLMYNLMQFKENCFLLFVFLPVSIF
jgi:hypothetical protein